MEKDFKITDMAYYRTDFGNGRKSSDMNHGYCWLETPYMCEGRPVTAYVHISKADKEPYLGAELYVADAGHDPILREEDYLRGFGFHNLEDMPGAVLCEKNGQLVMTDTVYDTVKDFVVQNLDKNHVMSYQEYSDWREIHEDRYGAMETYDYQEYLDSIELRMINGETFIGHSTVCHDLDRLRESDPAVQRDMEEDFGSLDVWDEYDF